MKEIHEKVKELKKKALEIIEKKFVDDISVNDMQFLCRCLNEIDDDKNWLIEKFATGFNYGVNAPNTQTCETAIPSTREDNK